MTTGDDNSKAEQEIHDLTSLVSKIDIDDPSLDRNETHMVDTDGKEIEFNEPKDKKFTEDSDEVQFLLKHNIADSAEEAIEIAEQHHKDKLAGNI